MAEQLFAIVFKGRLRAGADGAEVRANFAKLFNIDAARVEQMFSGQAVIIKKGLDLLAADKYKAALAKAGAEVDVIDMPATVATPAPAKPAATPPAAASEAATPAPASAPPRAAPPAAPAVDAMAARNAPPAALRGTPTALDTTLAEPGVVLVEAVHVPAPAIATEHLAMAEVGATMVDYTPPPAADYDLSNLTLAEAGVTLVEARKTAVPAFDLSGLSLDEPVPR
ncbi:MAG: hypothetical protein IPG43_21550 [Proteobacteria bacterium]|nr:hypothetical protein [Pseudomonadota bacterium]